MFGGTRAGRRHCHDVVREFAALDEYLITAFETILMKEMTMECIYDDTFDARDVDAEGHLTKRLFKLLKY